MAGNSCTCLKLITYVHQIFQDFSAHVIHTHTHWEEEPIRAWVQLFADITDIKAEIEILQSNLRIRIRTEQTDLLTLWKDRNFIKHVSQGCHNVIEQLEITVSPNKLEALETLATLDETISGDRCSSAYQSYRRDFEKYSLDVLIIWSQYSIASELIQFIVSTSSTDFNNLIEAVSDGDNQLVSPKIVRNLATWKHYFTGVYKAIDYIRSTKSSDDKLACFKSIPITNFNGTLEQFFETCSIELSSMKESYLQLTNKEESKRRQILAILQSASINFLQKDSDRVQFDAELGTPMLNFVGLSELRDRARLIEYSYSTHLQEDGKHQSGLFQLFIVFIDSIEAVLNTLRALYIAGHSMFSEETAFKRTFLCQEFQFDDLEKFSQELKQTLSLWEENLCQNYRIYPELTYLSCDQFELIEQFIYDYPDEQHYGYHLLKHMGLNPPLTRQVQHVDTNGRLESLGRILSSQRQPTLNPPVQDYHPTKKIFVIETTDESILRGILSFCQLFHSTPTVSHLFFCTSQTNWMQIRAFVYRCFYSGQFHQLIRPERLSVSIHFHMIYLIRELLEEDLQHTFRLGMITTIPVANLQLIDGLQPLKLNYSIDENDLIRNAEVESIVKQLIRNIALVTSRITSLGKSTLIRDKCDELNRNHIKFPINGEISADDIAQRLLKAAHRFRRGVIHLDIGVVNNYQAFNDLITLLVIFRSFRLGQTAVSIPSDTPIVLELDCSAHLSVFNRCEILRYIAPAHIETLDWEKFVFSDRIIFVANYLKAIDDRSITNREVTLLPSVETSSTTATRPLVTLTAKECIDLIRKYFLAEKNSEHVTWTQLNIYLSIYHHLFFGFSNCIFFSTAVLESSQLRKIRMDVLLSCLKSANMFTSASVEAVRRQQQRVHENSKESDVNQEFSNAIIRWDNTQPFTLIFSSTNDPIFVYKTDRDIPRSVKGYYDLYHRRVESKYGPKQTNRASATTMFPDYQRFSHEQLFQQLTKLSAKFFYDAICTKCFRRNERGAPECCYCDGMGGILERPTTTDQNDIDAFQKRMAKTIETGYVFTADNYLKMLLIFLRVESKVPVLIMGETGDCHLR